MISAIRILFVPNSITDRNREQVIRLYSKLSGANYDTVVFAESRAEQPSKKIPMPAIDEFVTPKGAIPVNDLLRNDFCDEDDDFYIDDVALGSDMAIYQHLPLLQDVMSDFSVVSVPICDADPAIVREFAYVMSEIMGGRNALLIVASELESSHKTSWALLKEQIDAKNISNLFNLVNSGTVDMTGSEVFIGGMLIANAWDLDIEFASADHSGESLNTGFAFASGL